MINPCLEPAGGKFQDAVILVEELAVTTKLEGAVVGTVIGRSEKLPLLQCSIMSCNNFNVFQIIALIDN